MIRVTLLLPGGMRIVRLKAAQLDAYLVSINAAHSAIISVVAL